MSKMIRGEDINALSNREAMGLSNSFTDSSIEDIQDDIASLSALSENDLCRLVESTHHDKKRRYAAGILLSLRGDPRINTLFPSMVAISGGKVLLGLNPDKVDDIVEQYQSYGVLREWILKECPQYEVDISPFKMGKYCVTNQEYRDFLRDTAHSSLPTSWIFGSFPTYHANHPVHTVSPEDAELYCKWLSQKTGRSFRLPTEQEWEYAAGGDKDFEFPWGEAYKPDHANTIEEGILSTTPIGMYPLGLSPFGVMDMAGNVEEYTSSDYRAYADGETIADDLLISEGSYRIARGGSFTRFRDLARTKRRHGWYKKDIYIMGFRLVEDFK